MISSKSGTTLEVESLFRYSWDKCPRGGQFVAITDPGTPLGTLARGRRFRRVFYGQPDVGGRFSALTAFGLVPAALKGIDLGRLLVPASLMADACRGESAVENPGAYLGAILGAAALEGMDKVTLLLPRRLRPFAAWLEQLIAESTGKEGRGLIPVDGEPLDAEKLPVWSQGWQYFRSRVEGSYLRFFWNSPPRAAAGCHGLQGLLLPLS